MGEERCRKTPETITVSHQDVSSQKEKDLHLLSQVGSKAKSLKKKTKINLMTTRITYQDTEWESDRTSIFGFMLCIMLTSIGIVGFILAIDKTFIVFAIVCISLGLPTSVLFIVYFFLRKKFLTENTKYIPARSRVGYVIEKIEVDQHKHLAMMMADPLLRSPIMYLHHSCCPDTTMKLQSVSWWGSSQQNELICWNFDGFEASKGHKAPFALRQRWWSQEIYFSIFWLLVDCSWATKSSKGEREVPIGVVFTPNYHLSSSCKRECNLNK